MILRRKIEIGCRVGMLTVAEKTAERKGRYNVWLCRCDCGGTVRLDTRCLQRGTVTDCGCKTPVKPGRSDLTGQRFGKLVCVSPVGDADRHGSARWLCRCDCGNTCVTTVHQLREGYRKSCGCLSHPPLKDYIGKKFGRLTVTSYAGKRGGMHRWSCLCDCGNEIVAGQTPLQNGTSVSCGCHLRKKVSDATESADFKGFTDGTNIGTLRARMSKPPISSNTSGYNGVYKNGSGLWSAQITFRGKTYYLGSFSDINEAVLARRQGEEMYENFLEWYSARGLKSPGEK